MHGADPGNTNDFGDNLAPSGPELSQYWCSQGENRFNAVSISGGSVYANDEDRERVVELDLRTGEVISSYPGVEGDTALGDTMLYVALFDVTGLDRTSGAEAWAFTEPAVIFDPPVLAGDLVLVVESPGESDTLYALDASTGVPRWSQPGLDRGVFSTVGVDAGVVVFPEREGILTFDLATGNPGPFYRGSVALGVVVVAGVILFDSAEDGLTALNLETASLRWESGQRAEPAVAVDEGVALGVGWGDDSKLGMYAYDLTSGTPIWRYSTGRQDRDALSRPTVAGGVAYFSIDSTIYAIEVATGELVWSADVGVNVWSDIIIANGLLMFGGEDGKLHAFGDR
jgi:outer membrane protein assembly factor BamB